MKLDENDCFTFGKHLYENIEEVAEYYPDYLAWCYENIDDDYLCNKIEELSKEYEIDIW